jgi:clan AA aspartic protease
VIGRVNADLVTTLALTVRDAPGQPHPFDAVVDTGFNGFLTLPPAEVAALGLPWLSRLQGQRAHGSLHPFDVNTAKVDWDGQPREIKVDAADAQPLLGMALLNGSELRVEVKTGGAVSVAGLP